MFGNNIEKRIAREADRISSMKEDLDALSWGRVLGIGKHLQSRESDAAGAELGSELVAIAQANISLATRLGIALAPPENQMMASGMEVLEGGFAQAALDHRSERTLTEVDLPLSDSAVPSSFVPDDPFEVEGLAELVAFDSQERSVEPAIDRERFEPKSGSIPVVAPNPKPEFESRREPDSVSVPKSQSESRPKSEPSLVQEKSRDEKEGKPRHSKKRFSRFHNLYESRDGGLCLFEDEDGHLVAVDASKLA